MPPANKAVGALRTIGELSDETGLPQHILRYWETRFASLRPLQRAGKRRYYRPEDVALVRRIDRLLNREGYTVRGVQQLLAKEAPSEVPEEVATVTARPQADAPGIDVAALRTLREWLDEALAES